MNISDQLSTDAILYLKEAIDVAKNCNYQLTTFRDFLEAEIEHLETKTKLLQDDCGEFDEMDILHDHILARKVFRLLEEMSALKTMMKVLVRLNNIAIEAKTIS